MKLLLSGSTLALFAVAGLQGCSSDPATTPTPTAGASSGGAHTGGGGATSAGAPATGGGGTTSAGAPATGGGGATSAGAPGTGGGGTSSGGAGGATAGAGGATAGAGGAGGATTLTCNSNAPFPAMGETCTTYCNNYDSTCKANVTGWVNDKYADKAACMTDCMNSFGYTGADVQSAICCRGYHVKNAAGSDANKMTHCPHAAGKMLCK
jgi:hypothetical protein